MFYEDPLVLETIWCCREYSRDRVGEAAFERLVLAALYRL